MTAWFWVTTVAFIIVAAAMVLIILVQRPQGGGLAGAFGGAGGAGTETVFGGRVGDALTWATVIAFVIYLGLAIALNLLDDVSPATGRVVATQPDTSGTGAGTLLGTDGTPQTEEPETLFLGGPIPEQPTDVSDEDPAGEEP